MGLFGQPNIEKKFKKKDCRGLIKALDHENPDRVDKAEEAPVMLADDKAAVEARRVWGVEAYSAIFKLIEGKESRRRRAVEPLVQALDVERKAAEKRAALAMERFEEMFSKRSIARKRLSCSFGP